MKKENNFRDLSIWKDSMVLVKETYALTKNLPVNEKFGFVSKMNRSVFSIPTNIAEGSGRGSTDEFVHFLRVALSSAYLLETQLILTHDLFDIDTTDIIEKVTDIQQNIGAYIREIDLEK